MAAGGVGDGDELPFNPHTFIPMHKPKQLLDRVRGDDRGQLGVFMVLILGAVALVVVSITLLFGLSIAGSFADEGTTEIETFTGDGTELTYITEFQTDPRGVEAKHVQYGARNIKVFQTDPRGVEARSALMASPFDGPFQTDPRGVEAHYYYSWYW